MDSVCPAGFTPRKKMRRLGAWDAEAHRTISDITASVHVFTNTRVKL